MDKCIRILHVEDNLADAELLNASLAKAGLKCEIVRVETREAFLFHLEKGGFDLIISDFSLPSFDGAEALRLAREKQPEISFLYFSGTIGEEAAVQAMIDGAADYVLKTNPKRLIPAIQRTLKNFEDSKERTRTQEKLRLTELQLQQSQKLEAIGRLAGGVAHDFNNLITVILSCCDFLQAEMEPGSRHLEDVQEIAGSAKRAAALTQQLLAFSRRQVLSLHTLDLNQVIQDMEKLVRRVISEDVQVRLHLDPDLPLVRADEGQIEQVLLNLSINSRDAMPKGGIIKIETKAVMLKVPLVGRHDEVPPGFYARFCVEDNGQGMNETVLSHLFEPFFTTKEKGRGTGLGLSTIFGIIKQIQGYVQVKSAEGQGCSFMIYLPQAREIAATKIPEPVKVSQKKGSETILLVEDDDAVRKLLSRVLKDGGYTVLEAGCEREALEIAGGFKESIHLILSDVVMPESDVRSMTDALLAGHPGARVIYMSGYMYEDVSRRGAFRQGTHFISKPITPEALLTKIRQVMDGPEDS